VGPEETMAEALDLDSMDFLNFMIGLHERTGVEIPELDYPQVATVEGCAAYLVAHM
jgi:acyl carrier protein